MQKAASLSLQTRFNTWFTENKDSLGPLSIVGLHPGPFVLREDIPCKCGQGHREQWLFWDTTAKLRGGGMVDTSPRARSGTIVCSHCKTEIPDPHKLSGYDLTKLAKESSPRLIIIKVPKTSSGKRFLPQAHVSEGQILFALMEFEYKTRYIKTRPGRRSKADREELSCISNFVAHYGFLDPHDQGKDEEATLKLAAKLLEAKNAPPGSRLASPFLRPCNFLRELGCKKHCVVENGVYEISKVIEVPAMVCFPSIDSLFTKTKKKGPLLGSSIPLVQLLSPKALGVLIKMHHGIFAEKQADPHDISWTRTFPLELLCKLEQGGHVKKYFMA